jgi:hypothetical protein
MACTPGLLRSLNVILCPALKIQAFGVNRLHEGPLDDFRQVVTPQIRISPLTAKTDQMVRANWLALDGLRQAIDIDAGFCSAHGPCAVSACCINEVDDAIGADRYAFMKPQSGSKLYRRPENYRLRAWDARGKTLSEKEIRMEQN